MNQNIILQPVMAMLLLTGLVWLLMYLRRLPYILSHNIDPQSIATPEQMTNVIPTNINNVSNNLKNLFELPVVFYVICIVLLITQKVDAMYVDAAWFFVGFRALHSLIHSTINHVNTRFTAYFLSSIALWYMTIRLSLSLF